MPNLGGVFAPSLPSVDIEEKNDRQIAELDVPGVQYTIHKLRYPGCAVALLDHGILENGPQPAYLQDGRYAVLLDGEIYNNAELRSDLGIHPSDEPISNPQLCAIAFSQLGRKAFEKLNGLFVLIIYDSLERRLTIASDRFGFRPLFFRQLGDCLLFGSELKAITVLDPSRSVDELGLFELFSYGNHVMDRTWLKGCRKLMPATILEHDTESLTESRYWTYAYAEGAPRQNQETYFTSYRCLMDMAVERCMSGRKRIGMFLSGGYDSRVVAASIRRHHLPIPAFTFGEADSRDVRFATILAEKLNLTHSVLHNDAPYLARFASPIVLRTEGMLPFATTTSMRFHDTLQMTTDIILVGLLGEFGGSHTWPALLRARTSKQAIQAIFERFVLRRATQVRRILNQRYYDQHFEMMAEAFRESFEAVPNEHPLNVADSWNFINFQHRGSFQAPSADRHRFEIRAPHMDSDLVRFLLTIPPWARLEQRVYKKMIAYGYPAIRSVPCTNTGKPVNPRFIPEYASMIFDLARRKAVQPFHKAFSARRSLGREFMDLNQQFCAEPALAETFLLPMLEEDVFPAAIFDRDGIKSLLDEQLSGKSDHALLLSLLLSWGLAAKYILRGVRDMDREPLVSRVQSG